MAPCDLNVNDILTGCLHPRAVRDEKIWGSLMAKHYIFVGVLGIGCFSIQWVVVFHENIIVCVVVLLKMQFCGHPSFKWDLVGC